MVAYSEKVIQEIRSAGAEGDIGEIVHASVAHFRASRNTQDASRFIMNMIVSLQVIKLEPLTTAELANIRAALALFRKYQQKNPDQLF